MGPCLLPLLIVATSTVETSSVSDAERAALEAEFGAALAGEENATPPPTAGASATPLANVRLIDLALDLLAAAGTSSAKEPDLRALEGGGHDPKNRGFTIQNVELTFSGIVDPYFRGDANIVLQIDPEGETTIELEEIYLTTLSLPGNLQLKAGHFFTAFGRLNPTHPHTWDFADQPVVNSRFMGPDGLRVPGLQLSWLTPLPFFLEVTLGAQNSNGETAVSFRNVPGETIAGRTLIDREVNGAEDFLYLAHAKVSFDLGEETTVVFGLSGLFGPNATADDTETLIGGTDLYLKWKPLSNDHGWPFFALQAEGMVRKYGAAEVLDESVGTELAPRQNLLDYGLYAQTAWGFLRPFVLALRYDFARGEPTEFLGYSSAEDPLRDRRHRATVALTYYPSEFSKLRIQYEYDNSSFLPGGDAHSVYVQAEIIFGAHGAHKF